MVILFNSPHDDAGEFEAWRKPLLKADSTMELRFWPDVGRVEDVDYALVWLPQPGDMQRYPNLKVIFNLGAGVDKLLTDKTLPYHLPIVRLVDPGLTSGMTEYVLMHTLRYHRGQHVLDEQQKQSLWRQKLYPLSRNRRVGIMGLGVLGADAAAKLVALDFDVAGWSRQPKSLPGVKSYHGEDGLKDFLARTEILVCLLPLTAETRGALNARLFAQLPKGAYLINAARGGHLVDQDLIAALDSGQIAHATLDVFHQEPLPANNPFWAHPKVTVTPHVASLTQPETAIPVVLEGIRLYKAGLPIPNTVDLKKGY
jgi:glyoxylate/hydroxypyruvate reductase A